MERERRSVAPLKLLLGALISRLRRERSWSLQDAADRLGASVHTLRAIEGGYGLLQPYHTLSVVRLFPNLDWRKMVRIVVAASAIEEASAKATSAVDAETRTRQWLDDLRLVDPELDVLLRPLLSTITRGFQHETPKPFQQELVDAGHLERILEFVTTRTFEARLDQERAHVAMREALETPAVVMHSLLAQARDLRFFPPSVAIAQLEAWEAHHANDFRRLYGVVAHPELLSDTSFTWPFLNEEARQFEGVFVLVDGTEEELARNIEQARSSIRRFLVLASHVKRIAHARSTKEGYARVWLKPLRSLSLAQRALLASTLKIDSKLGTTGLEAQQDRSAVLSNCWCYATRSSGLMIGFADDLESPHPTSPVTAARAIALSHRHSHDVAAILERSWHAELRQLGLPQLEVRA